MNFHSYRVVGTEFVISLACNCHCVLLYILINIIPNDNYTFKQSNYTSDEKRFLQI